MKKKLNCLTNTSIEQPQPKRRNFKSWEKKESNKLKIETNKKIIAKIIEAFNLQAIYDTIQYTP